MPQRAFALVSTLAIVAVVVAAAVSALSGRGEAGLAAGGALLVYVLIEGGRTNRGGRTMLAASAVSAAAALAFLPAPAPVLVKALAEAGSLIGLFTSLSFLRDAAETSPLVQRCGELMVRQPPGRRYLVLSLGSHLVSLVLNFGVLSLLGTMVMKGNTLAAAGGDARIAEIRRQRMMTAVLRGFALMTVWSPLSVSFAVTQAVVHGLPWWRLLPLQVALTVLLLGLGWAMDRRAFPAPPSLPGVGEGASWRPLGELAALILSVVAAAVGAAELLGVRPVVGAMLVVPPAAIAWLAAQAWTTAGPLPATTLAVGRFATRLMVSMPAFRNEVAMLGGAMFVGTVVSAFVSPQATAAAIAAFHLPPALLAVVLAWSVMVLAQVGISQIVTVTLLGSALADLEKLGLNPLVLASGLMGAWALSACSTPVGAAVLTVARIAEVPMRTVARQWNGPFVLAGAAVLAAWMLALAALL